MFTAANYKFCITALAFGWNAGGSLSAWVFVGVFLHDNCRWRAHLYLEGPTEQGCHLWEVMGMNFVLVSGRTGGAAVIEQWTENALVSQGRAEGWAIISRGETLAECRVWLTWPCASLEFHTWLWQISKGVAARLVSRCAESRGLCWPLSVHMVWGQIPESLSPSPVVQGGFAYFYPTSENQGGVKPPMAVLWAWRCKELTPAQWRWLRTGALCTYMVLAGKFGLVFLAHGAAINCILKSVQWETVLRVEGT